ncbi:condensation domain-containing protein [Chamaesiphon polymorphus]|uniref:Non-ribosomal peptide synthetase n=1 Tax=Chamaesiphon polymorphus CCALA 037 TaxID=2107692 RepID=A0A2T1GN28_9CYAN|nr:condensation domain-containing protein [Chamaesiphon polymorphus]PSB59232.1 non-ribosomal peptide synthetase [Chamaesiphon polymorphus CCALA 037]
MNKVDELLLELRSRDVRVWVDGDKLRYKAPKETLSPELLDRVKVNKTEIIAFLQDATAQANSQLPPIVAIDRHDRLSLSFAQQRLWFLHQFEPDSSSSNMPVVVRIEGSLDVDLLARSITEVFSRHEVLRTTFLAVDGQPTVSIAPPTPIDLPVIDLQHLPQPERDTEAARLATDEACAPFDLENGPILRVKLLRLSDRESLFIWNLHCIICDGASSDIFYQDLTAIYAALLAGKPAPLKDLPIQYVDFAHWQRQWLQGEVLDSQLKYWQQKLAHLPRSIKLPTDRVRPPNMQTYRGDRAARMLPRAINTALNTLSQEMGSTLFMVLLSAFGLLLHRYSMQEDLLINFASAGRSQMETEGLIGFFSNTLLLRTDFGGNPTFRELLTRVRQESLGAYAHQDIPFEKLIEELRPEENQSRSSLFQIKFALNPPWSEGRGMASVHLPDVTFTSLFGYIYHGKTKYDLTLVMREQDEGLGYVFDYNADLFESSTIDRMLDHFQNLLEGILANPDRYLSELPLLSLAEQQQLLQSWDKTKTSRSDLSFVHEAFEDWVDRTPDAIALVYEQTQLTYRELNCQANQLAHYLKSLGVIPGTHIGICLERSPAALVTLLSIQKLGATCIPIDPATSDAQIAEILTDAQANILVIQSSLDRIIDNSVKTIDLDSSWEAISPQPQTSPDFHSTSTQPAYILYPSQTDSKPIGVSIGHQGIIQLANLGEGIELTDSDVSLQSSSLASEVAIFEIWGSLLNGATIAILPQYVSIGQRFKPPLVMQSPPTRTNYSKDNSLSELDGILFSQLSTLSDIGKVLQQHRVTTVWLPTRLLHQLAIEQIEALKSLRQIFTGGDALSPQLVKKLAQDLPDCQLINTYSLPENTGLTCYNPAVTLPSTNTSISIGRAIAYSQALILDSYRQPVPIGIVGNLYIGGDKLAQGYFNRPELTASKFITHPFDPKPEARLYQTGELARYLPDGSIEIVGHTESIAKIYGLQIEVARIETALSQHPDIWESLVVMQPDSADLQILTAYIVPLANQTLSIAEIHNFIKQKVPAHMVPTAYLLLSALPIAVDGTINAHALPLPDLLCQPESTTFVAAQDELESQLTEIWETTLNVRSIGITDNFFDLGGNSLTAVRLFAQIATTFDKNLPLSILLKAPTIEQLATVIRQDLASEIWSPLVELQKGSSKQALFCIHGGGFNVLIYRHLALNLDPDFSVYGLQARGLDNDRPLVDRLEEMAADYINEIQRVQPEGPYLLAGLSNGGHIALEMAQQLQARGQTVALVAMFDSYGPGGVKLLAPFPRLLSSFWYVLQYSVPRSIFQSQQSGQNEIATKLQNAIDRLFRSRETSMTIEQNSERHLEHQDTFTDGSNLLDRNMNRLSSYVLEHSPWAFFRPSAQLKDSKDSIASTLKKLEESYRKAYKIYAPQPYRGKITVFRAMETPPGYQLDATLGWKKIAKNGVEIYKIPGDHTSIMESPILAQKMQVCIEQALANQCLP